MDNNTGLTKWDWLGAAAGLVSITCTILGTVFGYKGSQERAKALSGGEKKNG